MFSVPVTLDRTAIQAEGADVSLLSGMAVIVEIRTGTRGILSYLISPSLRITATALRRQ